MLTENAKLIIGAITLVCIYFAYTGAWYMVNRENIKNHNQRKKKIINLQPNIAKYFM